MFSLVGDHTEEITNLQMNDYYNLQVRILDMLY